MMRNIDVHDHYLTGKIPPEIAENLKEFFPEHDDLSYEEVLLQQESAYLYLQESGRNRARTSGYGQGSDRSHLSGQEGESSRGESTNSQVALDEALARSLQELGDDFEDFYIAEHSSAEAGSAGTGSSEVSPIETPARVVSQNLRQDDIDPDNMTYEARFKEKILYSNIFPARCVICCMVYSSGERLMNLPCAHQYHSECIKRWLKLKKHCPVCQMEVQDE